MEELLPLLIFLFFVLAPLLEKVLGSGDEEAGDEGAEPRPRPQGRRRAPQRPDADPPATAQRRPSGGEPAEEMLPDELWQVLTGDRRPQPSEPTPEPPREEEALEPVPAESGTLGPAAAPEPAEPEPSGPAEEPEGEPVEVPASTGALRRGEVGSRGRGRRPKPRAEGGAISLGTRSELQRAIILREVLGPPKGLE